LKKEKPVDAIKLAKPENFYFLAQNQPMILPERRQYSTLPKTGRYTPLSEWFARYSEAAIYNNVQQPTYRALKEQSQEMQPNV